MRASPVSNACCLSFHSFTFSSRADIKNKASFSYYILLFNISHVLDGVLTRAYNSSPRDRLSVRYKLCNYNKKNNNNRFVSSFCSKRFREWVQFICINSRNKIQHVKLRNICLVFQLQFRAVKSHHRPHLGIHNILRRCFSSFRHEFSAVDAELKTKIIRN